MGPTLPVARLGPSKVLYEGAEGKVTRRPSGQEPGTLPPFPAEAEERQPPGV